MNAIRLRFIDETFAGQAFELGEGRNTIGSDDASDLIIPHQSVSPRHCVILVSGPEVLVCGCESGHGVFVDSQPVKSQGEIKAGQVLKLGSFVLARLERDEDEPSESSDEMSAVLSLRRVMADRSHSREGVSPRSPVRLQPRTSSSTTQPVSPAPLPSEPPPAPQAIPASLETQPAMRGFGPLLVVIGIAILVGCLLWWFAR